MPLTVIQCRNDLLSKLGIIDAATASALTLQDVVVAINGAMQMLQDAGQEYFTKQTLTQTLSAGTAAYTIPGSVQSVLAPILWGSKPLRGLTSQGEYDEFNRIFLGGAAYGAGTDGDPMAYWVDFKRNGTQGDIVAIEVKVAPAPTIPAGTLTIQVVNDAPSYVVADLTSTNPLPVAQNYTESIFLPIARMLVTRSQQFSRPDLLVQLERDATTAMQRLGFAGGWPNQQQPTTAPRLTQG